MMGKGKMKDEIKARLTGASLFLYSALSGTLVQRCCTRTFNGVTTDSPYFSEMKLTEGEGKGREGEGKGRERGREGRVGLAQ